MKNHNWKTITVSVISYVLALVFFMAGGTKLAAMDPHPTNFASFGLPLWLMFVTGSVEVVGATLLLIRRTRFWGAALALGTMEGGVLLHFIAADFAGSIPAIVLASLASVVVWANRPTWLPIIGARVGQSA